MINKFTNILALIDLPEDPDICFRAAIETANRFESNLHILYRSRTEGTSLSNIQDDYSDIKIWTLQNTYRSLLDSRFFLHIHIAKERTKRIALWYAKKNKIDLVLIWKRDDLLLSAPITMIQSNLLSSILACPVLSLPRQAGIQDLKNIILPVKGSLPAGKLMLAIRLAKIFKAKVHLVGIVNNGKTESEDHFFFKACQLLRNNTNIDVECKMLKGRSVARATLQYGIKVNSGLILTCTGIRLLVRSVACLLLTRPVSAVARIPVMTVPVEQLNVE